MKKNRLLLCTVILSSILLSLFPTNIVAKEVIKKNVLLINSYHYGFEWSDEITKEIMETFHTRYPSSILSIEYMDSKRIYSKAYLAELCKIYNFKYSNQKIDVIIATDNAALEFLNTHGEMLFPNTPVVFCGINSFNDKMIPNKDLYTGICENVDIKTNLEIAFKLHPKTKQIAIVTDKTSTSQILRDNLASLIPAINKRVKLVYIDEAFLNVAYQKSITLSEDSIVFILGTAFRDTNGEFVSSVEFTKELAQTSNLPIYSLWSYYLNNGIVGGSLTSAKLQGRKAAEIAIRILNGVKVADIPILKDANSNELIFDQNRLLRYGINRTELPKGSTLINGPAHSFMVKKRTIFCTSILIIIILIIIICALSINILKRKDIEAALTLSEENYRKLIDFLPDAIYVVHNGVCVFSNLIGLRFLEMQYSSELVGQEIMRYVKIEDATESAAMGEAFLSNTLILRLHEVVFYTKKGREVYAETSSIAFPWEGKDSLLFVVRDITDRKQSEELKVKFEENDILLRESIELNALKTEFFTNMSHELKTPLNVVISSLQMLESIHHGNVSIEHEGRYNKYMKMMKNNCYRLIRLVDNMIDSTKIETGYLSLCLKNNNIINVVEDITLSVVKYVEDKGITLLFDTEIEEKIIACDSEKIERVILNLLSNATKFTEVGGCIAVNIYDRDDKILISVKDDGMGIPKDKLHGIFDRFAQVDDTISKNPHGSGLGLTIVKSLIEMHGGKISVESEFGKGTEFIIELPVKLINEDDSICNQVPCSQSKDRINIEFSDIES